MSAGGSVIYPSLDLPVRPEQFDHNGNIYIRTYGTLLRKPTSQDFFSWSLARRLYTAWIFLLFPVHVSRTLQFFNEGQTLSLTDMVRAILSHVLCSAAEREESATVVDHCSNIREVFKEQREVIELH